jgi:hypothetical protein
MRVLQASMNALISTTLATRLSSFEILRARAITLRSTIPISSAKVSNFYKTLTKLIEMRPSLLTSSSKNEPKTARCNSLEREDENNASNFCVPLINSSLHRFKRLSIAHQNHLTHRQALMTNALV